MGAGLPVWSCCTRIVAHYQYVSPPLSNDQRFRRGVVQHTSHSMTTLKGRMSSLFWLLGLLRPEMMTSSVCSYCSGNVIVYFNFPVDGDGDLGANTNKDKAPTEVRIAVSDASAFRLCKRRSVSLIRIRSRHLRCSPPTCSLAPLLLYRTSSAHSRTQRWKAVEPRSMLPKMLISIGRWRRSTFDVDRPLNSSVIRNAT